MNAIHLAGVDLNLLVAFAALVEEASVTRAAGRLGVTQSAMSHTLGRLRALFGDPLLVRGTSGMTATPRALALRARVAAVLSEVERVLEPPPPFEPATTRRTFRIAATDYAEWVVLPPLLARLAREAPLVDVVVRPELDDPSPALAAGTIDLSIGVPVSRAPGLYQQRLFDERFVCAVRRDHPQVGKRLTLARFVALRHALISPRGYGRGMVDEALAVRGLERRVALRLSHFLVAPLVIAGSDLVLTLPVRVATRFATFVPLRLLPPPLPVGGFSMVQLWHERSQHDPGHVWLRRLLLEESARV